MEYCTYNYSTGAIIRSPSKSTFPFLTSSTCSSSHSGSCDTVHFNCDTLKSTLPDLDKQLTNVPDRVWGWLVPVMSSRSTIPAVILHRDDERFTVGRDSRCSLVLENWMFVETDNENRQCNKVSRIQFGLYLDSLGQPSLTDKSMNGTFVNGVKVGQGGDTRLHHEDIVSILQSDLDLFCYLDHATILAKNYPVSLTNRLLVGSNIGSGGFSQVRKGFIKDTFDLVAMKFIKKQTGRLCVGGNVSQKTDVRKEVEILQSLCHPCIMRVLDVEESVYQLVIIIEFAAGGDLQTMIINEREGGRLCEKISKFRFYQISHALAYLHSVNVCHRDLKLANILLMEYDNPLSLLKVCDFGVSKRWSETTSLATCVGTPLFVAPEILAVANQDHIMTYSCKSDCWSLGVVLYMLLVGDPPFNHDVGSIFTQKIMTGNYREMKGGLWDNVSSAAKDLVGRLLRVKPGLRPAAAQIMHHDWLSKDLVVCRQARQKMEMEEIVTTVNQEESKKSKENTRSRLRPRLQVSSVSSNNTTITPGRGIKRKEVMSKQVVFLLPGEKRRRNSEVFRPTQGEQMAVGHHWGKTRRKSGF